MSVRTDTTDEQVDAASLLNHFLVMGTLGSEVLRITIEDMDILLGAVDMVEEVASHERVVTFGMVLRKVHILVHVEGQDILEGHATLFVCFYQAYIPSGDEPVGRPKTKGFSLVGWKALIRSMTCSAAHCDIF